MSLHPTILGEDMAFWKKKDNEAEDKCPLCSSAVSVEDSECPLCFYELKLSPRHQSLNITANEEDSLIGLLNADIEEEEEEEEVIREVADVIDLDAQEITVDAQYDDDAVRELWLEKNLEFDFPIYIGTLEESYYQNRDDFSKESIDEVKAYLMIYPLR